MGAAPHWLDASNPADGDANDPGDRKYPVCYTRAATMTAAVVFTTAGPLSGNLQIGGTGPGSLDFPPTVATINGQTVGATITCLAGFEDAVEFIDPLTITWFLSSDQGVTWHEVGISQNRVYVTLGDPTPATLFETLLLIGCKNAIGQTSGTLMTAAVWNQFTSVSDGVERADGVHMGYWLTGSPAQNIARYYDYDQGTTVTGILQRPNGDGSCAAWAQLLHWSLEAQGLGGYSQVFMIWPSYGALWQYGFLVKNWTFTGNGIYLQTDPDFPYHKDDDVTTSTRLVAQNNTASPPVFDNHWVCIISGKVYDPSYGVNFNTQNEHENGASDGFYKESNSHTRKNDVNTQEFSYSRDTGRESGAESTERKIRSWLETKSSACSSWQACSRFRLRDSVRLRRINAGT